MNLKADFNSSSYLIYKIKWNQQMYSTIFFLDLVEIDRFRVIFCDSLLTQLNLWRLRMSSNLCLQRKMKYWIYSHL